MTATCWMASKYCANTILSFVINNSVGKAGVFNFPYCPYLWIMNTTWSGGGVWIGSPTAFPVSIQRLFRVFTLGHCWLTTFAFPGPGFLLIGSLHALVLSCVKLFATPFTVAHQAPLSMGFPKQEYWSRLPFPSPEDLDSGVELTSSALQTGSLPLSHQRLLSL